MDKKPINKVTVVGAGFVGSTTAYTLMISGLVSELVLIDINQAKAAGEVMDLNHGMPFVRPVRVYSGTYSDSAGSDIVIITAGANQKPGETRLDLVYKNAEIFKGIVSEVIKYSKDCILLVVTNPVDILTYVTYRISGFPRNKVIGSGTVLDTARFRYLLGEHVGVDTRNIHAYIIGEHGDSEVLTWSLTNIAGIPMDKYCDDCHDCPDNFNREELYENVKNAAYQIIERKGATYYAIALAVRRIVEAIYRDEHSILTISSLVEGQYGLHDLCIGLPTVVSRDGAGKILDIPLSEREIELLNHSASSLQEVIKKLKI